MAHARARRSAVLLAAPLLVLTACGGSSGEDAAADAEEPAASESAMASPVLGGLDADDPGDDLLAAERWGGPVTGDEIEGSWRFPESYDPTGENVPNNEAESSSDGVDYRMLIGAYPGATTPEEAAEQIQTDGEAAGQTVEVEELTLGGREFVSVLQQDGDLSRRNLFHRPDEGITTFMIVLESGLPLDETPDERVAEFVQTAASLEVEPA